MNGSTKILTVSYGTFSCTLEGFDDPFGTMRQIAEYFRDLAADDRYFGAEPPTPDVEMLQRIAEKEVQRRVDARIGDNSIALTQRDNEHDEDSLNGNPAAVEKVLPAAAAAAAAALGDSERKAAALAASDSDLLEQAEEVRADHDDHDMLESGPLTADDDFLLSDEPEDVLAVDPGATVSAEGPAETVAEKLRRIRAVVSRSIEPQDERDSTSFRDALAQDADYPTDPAPQRDRAFTRTLDAINADLSDDEDSFDAEDGVDTDEDVLADAEPMSDDVQAQDEAPAFDTAAATEHEPVAADGGWDFDTDGLAVEPDENSSDEAGATRADVSAEAEVGSDEDSDALTVANIVSKVSEETEEEGAAETAAAEPVEAENPVPTPAASRPKTRPLEPVASGADVGRLMAETNNQLNDDESVRRRRVISQMRAAVAATKADRLVSRRILTPEQEKEAEQARYRDDLSAAVKAVSRPTAEPDKPSARKMSVPPLVLVSSQRVDESEPASAASAPEENFTGFAERVEAKELPELLEAAAAYTTFVDGQQSFTRPQIMKLVARVDHSLTLSREEGLRSFGQLLRQGKFRKLERGQFTIAETSQYNPSRQRYAGE